MAIITIDPGHGGSTTIGASSPNNAKGPNGLLEKNLTLQIAIKIAELLNNQGHIVNLTRNADVNLGLKNRAQTAFESNAVVFVSIHFNGDTNQNTQGTETWVHPATTDDSRLLASSIQQRVVNQTDYSNRGLKSNSWGVLNPAIHRVTTAACLVEISFITDPNDENRLSDINYILQLANAIVVATNDFLNKASSITPLTPPSRQFFQMIETYNSVRSLKCL